MPEAVKDLEEAYAKDPFAFSAFRLGIGRALQGKQAEALKLSTEVSTLSWGSDSLSRRIYSPLLGALRDQPDALSTLKQVTEPLAQQGAIGFLSLVKRDAELIHRSGLFAKQIGPVIALLDEALGKSREQNKASPLVPEVRSAPPP